MNKKSFMVIAWVLVVILGIIIKTLNPTPIWEINAKQFNKSFNVISGNATIDNLSSFTSFEWDTLYSFAPYTPEKVVYQVVGYQWDKINSTVSEGMNQIVFLKEGKVVCYIDGYPDKYKIFFEFGQYTGNHFKLTSSDKLTFHMMVTDGEIRKFNYVK
ncbi:hypothetical protein [Desulfosporosinus sp.]|uniref:hypothetical protein n=1 Tax=Desulfosporosinus sp. TaxID=157907 RepID=UPI0025BFA853|nr:hypothetical protein [Desulfosporosinus sp.]MBC2725087.1 hypothetical protein [Desulfosporosinus sp.]